MNRLISSGKDNAIMIESFSKAKRYMLNVVLNLLLAEGMLLIYVMRQSNKMYDMSRIV